MIPSMIFKGKTNPNFNQDVIMFGSYALVYTGTSNYMNRRSIPSISLKKSNDHAGHYFISLYTGNILHSYEWT